MVNTATMSDYSSKTQRLHNNKIQRDDTTPAPAVEDHETAKQRNQKSKCAGWAIHGKKST